MFLFKNFEIMKKQITDYLIALFWAGIFGYMLYKEMYVVVALSAGILAMILAFATSNEN